MNSFNNTIIMDELSRTDNPFSDIYKNAHDIFSSHDLPSPFNRIPSLDWPDRTVGLGPDRTGLLNQQSGPKVKDRTETFIAQAFINKLS